MSNAPPHNSPTSPDHLGDTNDKITAPAIPGETEGKADATLPKGVSIILYRDGKFAVSQRLSKMGVPGLWQFPGGHVEQGEDQVKAAVRELREETGIDSHEGRFTFIDKVGPLKGYKGEYYMGYRYGVRLNEGESPAVTEPTKSTAWKWVTPLELACLDMLQATKEYAYLFALLQAAPSAPAPLPVAGDKLREANDYPIARVMQTKRGMGGNCLAACLASIFQISIEEIPELAGPDVIEKRVTQNSLLVKWLEGRGFRYLEIDLSRAEFSWTDGAIPNDAPCLLAVKSHTVAVVDKGFGHFVVGAVSQKKDLVDIRVIHDPNGLNKNYEATAVGFFVPMSFAQVPLLAPALSHGQERPEDIEAMRQQSFAWQAVLAALKETPQHKQVYTDKTDTGTEHALRTINLLVTQLTAIRLERDELIEHLKEGLITIEALGGKAEKSTWFKRTTAKIRLAISSSSGPAT